MDGLTFDNVLLSFTLRVHRSSGISSSIIKLIENWKCLDMKPLIWCNLKHLWLFFAMLLIIFARRTCFTKFSPANSHPKDNERTSLCINLFFNGFIMRSRPEMGVNHNIIIGPSRSVRLAADIKVIKETLIHARAAQRRWLNQTLQRCGECKVKDCWVHKHTTSLHFLIPTLGC